MWKATGFRWGKSTVRGRAGRCQGAREAFRIAAVDGQLRESAGHFFPAPSWPTAYPGTDGHRTVRTTDSSSAYQEWSTPLPHTT